MFGRSERKTPFQREQNQKLENLRDDCIALFIDSGYTQKQIHERGGPTPATISKWLYGETQRAGTKHLPQHSRLVCGQTSYAKERTKACHHNK
jgi:hypothetical protein